MVKFQFDYNGEVVKLDLMHRARRSQGLSPADLCQEQLRQQAPRIPLQKLEDLVYLCNRNTIPLVHFTIVSLLLPHKLSE